MVYTLYNVAAGGAHVKSEIENTVKDFFPREEFSFFNIFDVEDKKSFMEKITEEDKLLIVGGDGTLNHFVNGIPDVDYPFPIYCYAGGTGNDFINDVVGEKSEGPIYINDYLRELPVVTVKGKKYKFLNGIGFGIDGYCCEVGDEVKKKTGKAPNYTKIAICGALYAYKRVNARVKIDDGEWEEYRKVWMVPAMNGRYFGGGMMITPEQDRLGEDKSISVAVVSKLSRLRLLTIFPTIFKGAHVKYTKFIKIRKCKSVEVEFDRPTALQIDGETILGVTSYRAESHALLGEEIPINNYN